MTSGEKSALLAKLRSGETGIKPGTFKCVHFILLPVICLMFFSYASNFYMIQQWIQHSVKLSQGLLDDNHTKHGCNTQNHSSVLKSVEKQTADWVMYNALATSIPAFFGALIVPSSSDSCGRKLLFLIGCSSSVIRSILQTLCVYYSWSLVWVVFATGLDSCTGGIYTFLSATMSYAADITVAGQGRTFGITLVDGCLLLCVTAAGLVSGFIIQYKGFVFLSVMNTACVLLAWFITITALPETYNANSASKAVSFGKNFKRIYKIYASKSFSNRRTTYLLLISAYFFAELTNSHRSAIEILYQLGQPLCWSADRVGVFTAARHLTQGLAGILFIVPLKRCMTETYIAIWSTFSNAASFVLEGLARTDLEMFLGMYICLHKGHVWYRNALVSIVYLPFSSHSVYNTY